MEGVSEVLIHISDALKNAEIHNYELKTWELAENGDARQILKILEAHPEETVALIATLSTLNDETGEFIPFKDIRKTMCIRHFNSDYWSTNRTRFLQEICSFEPFQLLKTITSDEYYVRNKDNIIKQNLNNLFNLMTRLYAQISFELIFKNIVSFIFLYILIYVFFFRKLSPVRKLPFRDRLR